MMSANMNMNAFALRLFLFFCFVFNFISPYFIVVLSQAPVTHPIVSFCTGASHACAVFNSKNFKCWGLMYSWGFSSSNSDSLGDASNEVGNSISYIYVSSTAGVDKVSCGYGHTCIRLDSGQMKCLGRNGVGQAGLGITTSPIGSINYYTGDKLPAVDVGTGLQVLDIALGTDHTCALLTGNKVKCFGLNTYGQLGQEHTINIGNETYHLGDNLTAIDLGTDVEVASIHSGPLAGRNCVILSAPAASVQRVKCWGYNPYGQLGYGDTNNRGDDAGEMGENLPLVNFGTESKAKIVALGLGHSCVLLLTDVLKCWGYGLFGQLASGSTVIISSTGNSMPSVTIDSGKKVKFVSTGYIHSCIAYNDDVTMKCFGYYGNGQLGQGTQVAKGFSPTTMVPSILAIDLGTGTLKISSIYSGGDFNCVVFTDNSVKCFGQNASGQLAVGTSTNVGDGPGEMGTSLKFAALFSPTKSPTATPTLPTSSPTNVPSKNPSYAPSKSPTTSPTISPSSSPVTVSPTTKTPSTSPTTKVPTISPTTSAPASASPTSTLTPTKQQNDNTTTLNPSSNSSISNHQPNTVIQVSFLFFLLHHLHIHLV